MILRDGFLPRPGDDFCDNPCDDLFMFVLKHDIVHEVVAAFVGFTELLLSEFISVHTISALREFAHEIWYDVFTVKLCCLFIVFDCCYYCSSSRSSSSSSSNVFHVYD